MKKLTFKQHLVTSAVCTTIIGVIVACGGHNTIISNPPPITAAAQIAHLFTHSRTGYHSNVVPASASSGPVLAGMFFFAASDIPESFEVACTFSPGFIASVPAGSIVPLVPAQSASNDCSRFFSAAQPASTLGLTPLFHAGTAQTLVINGKTANGTQVRCADLTNQTAVADNDFVPAYLDPSTNTIHLFDNTTQLANNCQLTVAAGDTVASLTVRWAKL